MGHRIILLDWTDRFGDTTVVYTQPWRATAIESKIELMLVPMMVNETTTSRAIKPIIMEYSAKSWPFSLRQ